MNILNLFRKKLVVPQTNETKTIDAVQLWTVRWYSRYSEYSGGLRKEMEAFTSETEAQEFKLALENAFKLLKHTSGDEVTLTQEK
jgi:hypothetical protein